MQFTDNLIIPPNLQNIRFTVYRIPFTVYLLRKAFLIFVPGFLISFNHKKVTNAGSLLRMVT